MNRMNEWTGANEKKKSGLGHINKKAYARQQTANDILVHYYTNAFTSKVKQRLG